MVSVAADCNYRCRHTLADLILSGVRPCPCGALHGDLKACLLTPQPVLPRRPHGTLTAPCPCLRGR
eukprot:13927731-Alexandrium_andersonii.AAC.1